jgi:hypothetical protein
MKGATAEPWVSMIRPPKMTIMMKMGNSQYFLRTQKRPKLVEERQHQSQNWFFMDSGVGPGGVLSIQ